jgi:glyoxylase-like metal-dependent hydrolase (beta-lactamase superfamily II)
MRKVPALPTAVLSLAAGVALAHGPQQPAAPPASAGQATPEHHVQPPDDPFTLTPLGGNVYALYGRGGNVGFFVGPDAVVVVDSQFKDLAPGIVKKIQGVTDKPIKYLVNTHHHGDHVGGNEAFRPFAVIVAHDNVRKRMLASPADILRDYPARAEEAKKAGNLEAAKRLEDQIEWARKVKLVEIPAPVLTFDSEVRIHVGEETIQVWHTPPAHTDGDGAVYFEKANVLHMGDLFFHKTIPVIDIRGGGSVKGYLAALDKVVAKVPANVTVIPGHGQVTDLAGLKAFRQYVVDVLDAARKAKAAGKSRDDFVKEAELPQYKDHQGYPQRFKANCGAAYDEV